MISDKNIGIYGSFKIMTKVVMITLLWNYTAKNNGKKVLTVQCSRINKQILIEKYKRVDKQ